MPAANLSTAERLVRDALEGLALRHHLKRDDAVSALVVRLAEALAAHLSDEVKAIKLEDVTHG